jgi:hypothetical protein|tara:strand:+ start:1797 stop:3800 length:2004 start_codon:yes stop_codon:yes gene_type:complete
MRSLDDLKRWKDYGFVLTPVAEDKSPGLKPKQKWKYDWSDETLLSADRLGVFHDPSSVFSIDFDDDDYVAHKYLQLLPDTFTDGKVINGHRVMTHRTYKANGQGAPSINGYPKYPKNISKKKGLLVEVLTGKQTIFTGGDRFIALDIPPAEVDIKSLEKKLKLICFFTEVEKVWSAEGGRDEAHLRLAGALAKLPADEYPEELLQQFQEQLCINTGDHELKNRTQKIRYQRKQLENGKKIFGITELRSHLESELEAYNLLFEEEVKEEDTDPKEYPLIDGLTFDTIEYPKVNLIVDPIIPERSFNQIYGYYESGKTMFGVALSMAMCSGRDFLGWTIPNPVPTLYVESELPGDQFRSRRNAIKTDYFEKGIPFRAEHHFTLTQDDLTMAGFKYGFKSIAVAQHEGKDAAKDYGRKGREFIENILYKIEQRTGRKPFYFLDNMTRLATIDENKAPDWHPFINWGIDIKNKGFAGCFVHHANKGGNSKGSSGSSTIGRLLDTSIALRKLDNEYRFDMTGKANMQSSIEFDKSRGFGGSDASKKRIITMNEYGEWKAYPYLKQVSFQILKFHNQGMSQKEIREIHKELDLSAPSVDRLYKELVELKLIQKERKSHCWKCKKEISHTQHERCQKCTSGIICNHIDDKTGKECGACYCENPKRKKNENKTPY